MWINCCGVREGGAKIGGHLEGVLGSESELSDFGWKIFLGDLRLAEIWLPFNAHPGVRRGRVVSAMVVLSPVGHLWNQKRILMQDTYLVLLTTSYWFYDNIHVHMIHPWFWKYCYRLHLIGMNLTYELNSLWCSEGKHLGKVQDLEKKCYWNT